MSAIQFVPTVVLVLLAALLVDAALARVVPGASDNASGVAAVLEVAGRLERRPDRERRRLDRVHRRQGGLHARHARLAAPSTAATSTRTAPGS